MKFAIFGDIHGNLEALQAVLRDAQEQGCGNYVCLGDIVGYWSEPRGTLASGASPGLSGGAWQS